jgi:CheY-like chemotaxis protein
VTPKLLLADDSVTIQRVIELTFADEDVEVVAVGDGQQAIDRVRSDRPDIVLADVGMPERDGYEVAAFIKGDPQLAHIPVLLLTGAFEPVDEVRARAVGCDGVLVKPFEPQMVISRVRDLLAGHREAPAHHQPPLGAPSIRAATDAGIGSAFEEATGSLEDYFDRLDAALASKQATTAAGVQSGTRSGDIPRSAPAPTHQERIPVTSDAVHPGSWDPATSAQPTIPSAIGQAPPASPSPVPEAPTPPSVSEEALLQQAFSTLLSTEQHTPPAPAVIRLDSLPNEVLDEIARRVIARMGDDSMRAAVLDAAERLVREEIDRIKSQG